MKGRDEAGGPATVRPLGGTLLGSESFTTEGTGGWQTASFATPIAISANTTYVASYNSNVRFSATAGSIATSVRNGPLATVADGANGVYTHTRGSFPSTGTNGNNYFADVVFEAQQDGVAAEQLRYDAQDRLVQVTLGSPITETITLSYNALGQRAIYSVMPTGASQPSVAEHFQYQGDQLSQVAYTGTSITTPYTDTYVYTQDGVPLQLLRQVGGTATPYWYVVDGQSNVVALTNQAGSVVDSYTYDQWGRPISISQSVSQQLRYAGYWYDNELGWYWLSVRSYDPVLERFLQPDPSEMEGLFSYDYAGDNPADRTDATGLIAASPQTGCLLTTGDNIECNVQVNSAQWKRELANGATQIFGIDGALLADLLPTLCGHSAGVCLISLHANRRGMGSRMAMDCGPVAGVCNFFGTIGGAIGSIGTYFMGGVTFLCDVTICGDAETIRNGPWYMKVLAAGDILLTFAPGVGEAEKVGELLVRSTVELSAREAEEEAVHIAGHLALDNNILNYAINGNELTRLDQALGRRTPVISPQARAEFLNGGGSQDDLQAFMDLFHAMVGTNPTATDPKC